MSAELLGQLSCAGKRSGRCADSFGLSEVATRLGNSRLRLCRAHDFASAYSHDFPNFVLFWLNYTRSTILNTPAMALHGGIITKRPLCYTADGRLLLAPCGNDIRVYSSKSGEHIATLRGHEAEVTSVAQMDSGSSKLVSSSRQSGSRLLQAHHARLPLFSSAESHALDVFCHFSRCRKVL